jgi:hypothetical protein
VAVLEFELGASYLLDRDSTIWAKSPALLRSGYFGDRIFLFAQASNTYFKVPTGAGMTGVHTTLSFFFFFFFFEVLGLELRAYILSNSTSPFFVWGGDIVRETICQAGFEPWSS